MIGKILVICIFVVVMFYIVALIVTHILDIRANKKHLRELGIFWAEYDTALEKSKRRKCYEKETSNDGSCTGSDV